MNPMLIGPGLDPGKRLTPIRDLRPMMRSVHCEVIVLEKVRPELGMRDGKVLNTFWVADRTGSVVLDIWGEPGTMVRVGDILRITNGEAKLFRDKLHLAPARSYGRVRRIGQQDMIHLLMLRCYLHDRSPPRNNNRDTFHFNEAYNVSAFDWTTNPDRPGPMPGKSSTMCQESISCSLLPAPFIPSMVVVSGGGLVYDHVGHGRLVFILLCRREAG
ncbi:hypothetical protein SYNPS1DRAFT_26982 [Syncephalis pseudoplumigaleata]|uniref:OB domain-containing protein n=1 Tax=Syncephalis pseudoplumigaleata TaxID=1712513 RepID=A0A4P9Z478_9FUNG|nr:hypothetical protein SYNPS1DRAFT_26982 [Syncephalis pseudoplumigaleata]|eukprot:RKP27364.1 hypothetical protein SYNPS1DRAFT_26982 [Syncephalis pseudoplumigaleata]